MINQVRQGEELNEQSLQNYLFDKSLIDSNVDNLDSETFALSKSAFAENVYQRKGPFLALDHSHFAAIFELLQTIIDEHQ